MKRWLIITIGLSMLGLLWWAFVRSHDANEWQRFTDGFRETWLFGLDAPPKRPPLFDRPWLDRRRQLGEGLGIVVTFAMAAFAFICFLCGACMEQESSQLTEFGCDKPGCKGSVFVEPGTVKALCPVCDYVFWIDWQSP